MERFVKVFPVVLAAFAVLMLTPPCYLYAQGYGHYGGYQGYQGGGQEYQGGHWYGYEGGGKSSGYGSHPYTWWGYKGAPDYHGGNGGYYPDNPNPAKPGTESRRPPE